MLRRAQHERKFINEFKANSVRPEPRRRVNGGFSARYYTTNSFASGRSVGRRRV
jgi:hypothetical protein